jgi:hypothetical protein
MISPQARGKSGPLFEFGVHEDIRVLNDASREKNESHAGKVVERHWYDRNKHIFPASRWEVGGVQRQGGGVICCAVYGTRSSSYSVFWWQHASNRLILMRSTPPSVSLSPASRAMSCE